MPSLPQIPALSSPPSNAWGLIQYVASRIPGYDLSEYLRELNSAYIHVWEEVSKLKNHYFTNQKTVNVVIAQNTYDLLFNSDNALSAPISNRLYQITRIRVRPPAGSLFQTSRATHFNDNDFLAVAANPSSNPTQTGPYYYVLTGRGSIQWGLPLGVGTTLEVTYSFWPLGITYLFDGTASSATNVLTGSGSFFTNIVPKDFQTSLPTSGQQEEIQAELVVNTNQVYRVLTVTNDTTLTTANTITPALTAGSQYIIATLPEIPREHIRVIASLTTRNMYSLAGDDARVNEWTAIATANIQSMKDSLEERQNQNPPAKGRFPYGLSRRNRAFLR